MIGSLLAITTMILHPVGGDMEHIIEVSLPLRITHALAIFCLPFILFGFYGVTHKLTDRRKLSILALIIIAFGLFAVMLAALVNGLALPFFLEQYAENIEQNSRVLHLIVNYGFAINKALDYVFIGSCYSAIGVYSLLVMNSQKLPKWIGYFGIIILLFAIVNTILGYLFTSLAGFRMVVFSIAAWILCVGILLIQSRKK